MTLDPGLVEVERRLDLRERELRDRRGMRFQLGETFRPQRSLEQLDLIAGERARHQPGGRRADHQAERSGEEESRHRRTLYRQCVAGALPAPEKLEAA